MKYLLFIFSFFVTNIATAQLSVHTGFLVGENRHTFTVEEQDAVLQPGTGESMSYGVPFQIAKGSWSFQTGLFSTKLTRAYYFETPDGTQYGSKNDYENSISTLEIPFIISKEFKLVNRVSLAPKVGLAWLTNRTKTPQNEPEEQSGTINEPNFSVIKKEINIVNKNKFLAKAGADLNIYPFRHLILTAGVTYRYGLQSIETTAVTYQLDGEEMTETLVSDGSGFNFYVGLKIPLVAYHGGHIRRLFD